MKVVGLITYILCNIVQFQRHQATVRAVVYFPSLQAFPLLFFMNSLLYPFFNFLTPHALGQSFTSHLHPFYLPSLPRHFFLLSLLIPFVPPVCASLSLCLAFLQVQFLKSLSPFIPFPVNTLASKAQNLPFQTSPKSSARYKKYLYLIPPQSSKHISANYASTHL